ncbi:MAG: hypothetical protein V3T35_05865, partial [Spirochaetia bacterium]
RGSGWQKCKPGDYIVSYELSPGFYDAYIWGQDVRRLDREELDHSTAASPGFSSQEIKIVEFLTSCINRNIRLIEDVREHWIEWCDRFFS